MLRTLLTSTAAVVFLAGSTMAEDISTHVLNIATGQGGADIPVTLEMMENGDWTEIGTGKTAENGRVEGFDIEAEEATYRLSFNLSGYEALGENPFFPEIDVIFAVQDTDLHHHVPVLVSPFGYSTYLGN